MANNPADIPIRSNQDTIKASWFNEFRTFLIDAFGAVTGETLKTILNNQSSAVDVDFSVDAVDFTSAKIPFEIIRSTSLENRMELGQINLYYKNSTWYMVMDSSSGDNSLGDIESYGFSIVQAGTIAHLKYKSDNMSGTGYVGTIKLKANYFST